MIQQLQAQQAALLDKATKAEQEAVAAKAELAETKQELAAARNQIAAATSSVAPASDGSYPTHTTMGSQLSDAAVTVNRMPGWYTSLLAGPIFLGEAGYDFAFASGTPEDIFIDQTSIQGNMQNAADDAAGVSIEGTIGKRYASGIELSGTLAYANVENSSTLRGDNNIQVPPLSADATSAGEFGDLARAKVDVTRWAADLDASKTVGLGSDVDLRVVAGLRIAISIRTMTSSPKTGATRLK